MNQKAIIAVFPGQGSQHVGMAKDLHDNFKLARQVFEEASDATHTNLMKLCFDGPESDLRLTENTQPCLLTASVAAFRVAAEEFGFAPVAAAGHSLGEYSALVAARGLSLSHAARLVKERGKAMQEAVPAGEGAMAAIMGLGNDEETKIHGLCELATAATQKKRAQSGQTGAAVPAIVEPANFNAPGQIVIAGSVDGIQEAIALVKAGGDFAGKAVPLQVSAPFHCALMAPAKKRMAELFSQLPEGEKPRSLAFPYVPNRTARISREAGPVLDLLIEQVDHPVLWTQSMTALLQMDYAMAVEMGPGKVLAGLMKRIAQPMGKTCQVLPVNDTATMKTFETALKG